MNPASMMRNRTTSKANKPLLIGGKFGHHRLLANRNGVALIIVLSFLVLLAGVMVAFFSLSVLQKQVSTSSANQTAVEVFARGALNNTVGDLQQEIVAGSTATAVSGTTIYVPSATTNAVPALVGVTSTAKGTENLVKRSARSLPFYTNGPTRAAASATTTASSNGRSITLARWNKPLLLTKANPALSTDLTPAATFTAPDWILVARDGSNPTTFNSSSMAWTTTATTTTAVVGRYAYTIYDEGGLLDANVAGYPSTTPRSSTDTSYSYKNAEAFADLTQLGYSTASGTGYLTQAQVNALVGWRNNQSMSASGSLPNYTMDYSATGGEATFFNLVTSNVTGFLTTANTAVSSSGGTDHLFASRQQLINFFTNGVVTPPANGVNSTSLANVQNALQYLGTFTRAVNAPSYTPPKIGTPYRPPTSGPTATGSDDTVNPSLINTRVTTSFVRDSDGTTAQVGDPLLKYRFPLSRINLLINAPSSVTGTSNEIYKYFGLTRSNSTSPWYYKHPTLEKILPLSQVALLSPPREPDFFELLQAAIQVGSLGSTLNQAYNSPSGSTYTDNAGTDYVTTLQILQIGANLIDQYDPDSFPTRISFGGSTFASPDPVISGIENLPYLSRVFNYGYAFADQKTYGYYLIPEVWNPQTVITPATSGPSTLRFVYAPSSNPYITTATSTLPASVSAYFYEDTIPASNPPPPTPPLPGTVSPPITTAGLTFSPSGFANPTMLGSSAYATASGYDSVPAGNFVGCCAGMLVLTTPLTTGNGGSTIDKAGLLQASGGSTSSVFGQSYEVSFLLQYQSGSSWITYDQIRNTNQDISTGYYNFLGSMSYYAGRADPRCDRFGVLAGYLSIGGGIAPNAVTAPAFRVDNTAGQLLWVGLGSTPLNWNLKGGLYGAQPGAYYGCLSENLPPSTATTNDTSTIDPDGLTRPAEGAYTSGISGSVSNGGYPMATDTFDNPHSRPIILNRPFRSVAEMGYASRGQPWKELDFFTAYSGDAALLDAFTVEPTPLVPVIAGQVDLNTRQPTVLQALINGAIKEEAVSGSASNVDMTSNDAANLAAAMLTVTTTGTNAYPLQNRSELATRYSPVLSYAITADSTIKRRREAAVRALTDVGNTRTWNLLIDLVAQTGRYLPNAASADQFTVEGEHRYWLHVAIDRYTGKVVSQSLESVNE